MKSTTALVCGARFRTTFCNYSILFQWNVEDHAEWNAEDHAAGSFHFVDYYWNAGLLGREVRPCVHLIACLQPIQRCVAEFMASMRAIQSHALRVRRVPLIIPQY